MYTKPLNRYEYHFLISAKKFREDLVRFIETGWVKVITLQFKPEDGVWLRKSHAELIKT